MIVKHDKEACWVASKNELRVFMFFGTVFAVFLIYFLIKYVIRFDDSFLSPPLLFMIFFNLFFVEMIERSKGTRILSLRIQDLEKQVSALTAKFEEPGDAEQTDVECRSKAI